MIDIVPLIESHRSPARLRSIVAFLILFTILLSGGCSIGQLDDTPITYLADPSDTEIAITGSEYGQHIEISSNSGIGDAIFWVNDSTQLAEVEIRMNLQGLEKFTFEFDDHAIRAQVVSHGDHAVTQTQESAGGSVTPIDSSSPYWLEITPVGYSNGMANYFDVKPPTAIAAGGSLMFKLSWIDFYR